MRDDEWCLVYTDTNYTFGTGASEVFNRTTPDLGDVEIRHSDAARPRGDGVNFGQDFRGNRTIAFDLGVQGSGEVAVRASMAALSTAWRADVIRAAPGVAAEMRMRYRGQERVVFGRPRRFAATLAEAKRGFASAVADFVCADDRFYSVENHAAAVAIEPPLGGGLLAPLSAPLATTESSDRSAGFTVESELPAWPVITVFGPITNPRVAVTGLWAIEVNTTLAEGEALVIDTQPWARTVLVGTGSRAGSLTRASTRLANASLPPGAYEFSLSGISAPGTAVALIRWRDAFSTL